MSYATIRAAIKTTIEGVTGITGGAGKVIDHEPQLSRSKEFKETFGNSAGTKINGWTISRESISITEEETGFRYLFSHGIIISGYFSLMEAETPETTELTFQDLLDAIILALIADTTIWINHPERTGMDISIGSIGHTTFSSALLHFAELRFNVDEAIEVTS